MSNKQDPIRQAVKAALDMGLLKPGDYDGTATRIAERYGVTRQRIAQVVKEQRILQPAPEPPKKRIRRKIGMIAPSSKALVRYFREVGEMHFHRTADNNKERSWRIVSHRSVKCGTDQCLAVPIANQGVKRSAA